MINLDPQRLVASIHKYVLILIFFLKTTLLFVSDHALYESWIQHFYRCTHITANMKSMWRRKTWAHVTLLLLLLLLLHARFCFTQRPTRIANCQKFTQLPRPPRKELTTPTTQVPLAHTKWSLVVNTKMGENYGNSIPSPPLPSRPSFLPRPHFDPLVGRPVREGVQVGVDTWY
jgi:hypothetical protein